MTEVWDTPGTGFGDMWAALGYLMRKSVSAGVPSLVSRWAGQTDMKPRLLEMLALFEPHPTASVLVTDGKPTTSMWQNCWAGLRWPSVVHWTPPGQRKHRIIAHQFDGRSSSERKNPPVPDLASFNSWLAHSGAVGIHLGLPLSMRECATWMALADLFVGSCSGMAHLGHSVGVPVHLVQYEHGVPWWHGDNPITLHKGMAGFLESQR